MFAVPIESYIAFIFYKSLKLNCSIPSRQTFVDLIDQMDEGIITWEKFEQLVKKTHANRLGGPYERKLGANPRLEENFYANPLPGCICKSG